MKKFVRLVTLMLVLAMAVTVLALPAAAVTDCTEGCAVELRGPAVRCSCGGFAVAHGQRLIDGVWYWVAVCDTCGAEYLTRA